MAPQRTLLFTLFLLFSSVAWNREHASTFARDPSDRQKPEGIAMDHAGNVYVADFEVKGSPPGHIVVSDDRSGRFLRDMAIPGSSNLLLGLLFQASTGRLLVADLGNSQVLSVEPHPGAATVFTKLPAGTGPNA